MEYTDILKSIGLAARARKVVFGSELTYEGVKNKRVVLVLVSSDASDKTKKNIIHCCSENDTEYYILKCDGTALAHALGKAKPLAVVGITDENICVPIKLKIKNMTDNNASLMTFSESEV